MYAHEKNGIRVGTMLSDSDGNTLRVTGFVFSEGETHKYGEPVEDNVVHVEVYEPTDLKQPVIRKNFLHLNFVEPAVINYERLNILGFREAELNDQKVYQYGDYYFDTLANVGGLFIMKKVDSENTYPVEFIHQVQIIAANEK